MNKYKIAFTETILGFVDVEAENEELALEIAESLYERGELLFAPQYPSVKFVNISDGE